MLRAPRASGSASGIGYNATERTWKLVSSYKSKPHKSKRGPTRSAGIQVQAPPAPRVLFVDVAKTIKFRSTEFAAERRIYCHCEAAMLSRSDRCGKKNIHLPVMWLSELDSRPDGPTKETSNARPYSPSSISPLYSTSPSVTWSRAPFCDS